ncbi:MAG TPA: hypothetical protein VNH44_05075 [Micropepsaceae bacterium]|nr:hypothetical protein [Micropepsaceae bacterium]
MRWAAEAALAGLLVAGVTTNGFSATTQEGAAPTKSPAPPKEDAAAAPTIDSVVGKKLVSIDGSVIALTASEGGLAREIVASNGAVQRTALRFINDRLGTVSDSRDANKVIGVFRMSGEIIEIQYADGNSETVLANTSGGISIESRSGTGQPYCTAWYPEGHMFSLDDRKAALAQYASKLGLAESGDKKSDVPPRSGCSLAPAAHVMDAHAEAMPPAHPAVLASAGVAASAKATAPKTSDVAAAAGHAIDVRTSEVHPIDPVPTVAEPTPPPQVVASLGANQAALAPATRGASSCLSVDSDGSHWGFRNHCAYTVQFAYCLTSASALASCQDGAIAGSVAGNGFGALVADESLKETDAAHDFRWVACQGGAGEVIPRLDQTDPPSGRCVR